MTTIHNHYNLSEHDRELVERVNRAKWYDEVDVSERDAESPEARRLIHARISYLYHLEEASIGCV